ncbi:MAG: DinB family protein [Phycisphaeraceae bacterium]|nr:DinB family protein [Phycisphaeraceae bacterium]
MGTLAQAVADNGRLAVGVAEMLLKDVPAERAASLPRPGGHVIRTNHPVFVIGHLSLYPNRIAALAGLGDGFVPNPPDFEDLFAAGKECVDDPEWVVYPRLDRVAEHYFAGHAKLLAALPGVGDDALARPHGMPSEFARKFHTTAGLLGFYLGGHQMMHMGQLSAWRRCMGLGRVF